MAGSTGEYAILRTGGKQFKAVPGAKILVDRVAGNVGDTLELSEVLYIGTLVEGEHTSEAAAKGKVGKPLVSGAKVTAKIVAQPRAKKIIVFKKKRRTGYTKKQGHRQEMTELLIQKIQH